MTAFGSKIKNVCGVGSLVRGDVIAEGRGKGLRAAELKVSTDCVACCLLYTSDAADD